MKSKAKLSELEFCDQGACIIGLRGSKNFQAQNYGVIITARCDIAQNKTDLIHMLSGINFHDWIINDGLKVIATRKTKEYIDQIKTWSRGLELDTEVILQRPPEKILEFIEVHEPKAKKKKKLIETINEWVFANSIINNTCTLKEKITAINVYSPFKKIKQKVINELIHNEFADYYFLPKCYFKFIDDSVGMVVQMRDIVALSDKIIVELFQNGYDVSEQPELKENQHINSKLKLDEDSDFVYPIGVIESPYIEHLMQRFSNLYTRIGLEDIPDETIKKYIDYTIEL